MPGHKEGASYRPNYDMTDQPPPARPRHERSGRDGPTNDRHYGARSGRPEAGNGAPPVTNPYIDTQALNLAYRPPQRRQQASDPYSSQQQQAFDPQASNFQPGQSRYSLIQKTAEQTRLYDTGAADRVIQSIEPHVPIDAGRGTIGLLRGGRARRSTPRFSTPLRDDPERPVTPPPAPEVSAYYFAQAQAEPEKLKSGRKLLVVLDLNGTLLVRDGVDRRRYTKRPGLDDLLTYLFANHAVMVCTSAKAHNAQRMINDLFTNEQRNKIITIRARQMLGLTPKQFNAKVQVYKNLNDIWADPKVKASVSPEEPPWSMANTILLDDSVIKAAGQPHNLIHIPEFVQYEEPPVRTANRRKLHRDWTEIQEAIMMSVIDKLEQLKMQSNVACLMRQWQVGDKASPGIVNETVDKQTIEEMPQKQANDAKDVEARKKTMAEAQKKLEDRLQQQASEDAAKSYPTPKSGQSSSSESDGEGVKLKPVPQSTGKEHLRSPRSPSPVTEEHFQFLNLK